MHGLAEVLRFISIFSGLAGLLIGWKDRHLLWYYVIASLVSDVWGLILRSIALPIPRLGNIFLLAEFLLVSVYLLDNTTSKPPSRWPQIAIAAIAGGFVIDTSSKSWTALNASGGAVLYSCLILLLLWVLYTIIRDIEVLKIERSPLFIFCAGMLLYVSGNLIVLLARGYLEANNPTMKEDLKSVTRALNILKNAAVAYSLFLYKRDSVES